MKSLVISRPTTDQRIAAYRVAYRASLSHLRSGCMDCGGGRLCPLGQALDDRADETSAALPWNALSRVRAETFADQDDDSYGIGGFVVVLVAAISGCFLFGLPLLLLLWPSAIPTLGR